MFRRIINIALLCVIIIFTLGFGGYSLSSFKHELKIKSPHTVLSPLFSWMPSFNGDTQIELVKDSSKANSDAKIDINSKDSSNSKSMENDYVDSNGNLKKANNSKNSETTEINTTKTFKLTINGKSIEFSSKKTISMIKWLNNNYKEGDKLSVDVIEEDDASTKSNEDDKSDNSSNSDSKDSSKKDSSKSNESKAEETKQPDTSEITYEVILDNVDDLDNLIASISVVDKLPNIDGYDRKSYESPSRSYKFNGKTTNRNDYSWKNSPFLISEDPYEYICPYTGDTITDESKLDYDHIVPLKSSYLRGANEWSAEQQNDYAYNQWIGVDVVYSANRSKSDKGPEDWLPTENIEDYCYSWILICSYYNLDMTNKEIEICEQYIKDAFEIGETVEFLGGEHTPKAS